MKKIILLWTLATVITLGSAVYQRLTGPTHPIDGRAELAGAAISFRLERSHGGPGDQEVTLLAAEPEVEGSLSWRRFPTDNPWTTVPLVRRGDRLSAQLPHQPPAGKLEYRVHLVHGGETLDLPAGGPATTRFKGAVPASMLIPHIIFMFAAMLVANRAGLEALSQKPRLNRLPMVTTVFLFLGGLLFGPAVQYYAFGQWWTGFPLGMDLTDNKTAIAFAAWVLALIFGRKGRHARWWVLAAALVMLLIFSIPHSMFGSELQYR